MTVAFETATGHATFLDDSESSWSTAWDLPDNTKLLMCLVSNFFAYTENAPTYNSVAFDLLQTSASNSPRVRLYGLYNPPVDSGYTVGITWTASFQYWSVRFVAFSGSKNNGIGTISQAESIDWNGSQASKPGDLVTLWAANRADPNPTLTWDSPGTERFSVLNDSTGQGEMRSGMATYPGLASTPIGVLSGGTGPHTHIMYNNIEAIEGSNKMILMMSEIYDRIQDNRKKLGVGDLGNFGLRDRLWKPKGRLATI